MNGAAWLACAALLLGATAPAAAPAGRGKPAAARKPKPRPPPRPEDFEAEANLHAERLAVVARLRQLSGEVKDAELAATVERLERKEQQRHALAMGLLSGDGDGP